MLHQYSRRMKGQGQVACIQEPVLVLEPCTRELVVVVVVPYIQVLVVGVVVVPYTRELVQERVPYIQVLVQERVPCIQVLVSRNRQQQHRVQE